MADDIQLVNALDNNNHDDDNDSISHQTSMTFLLSYDQQQAAPLIGRNAVT